MMTQSVGKMLKRPKRALRQPQTKKLARDEKDTKDKKAKKSKKHHPHPQPGKNRSHEDDSSFRTLGPKPGAKAPAAQAPLSPTPHSPLPAPPIPPPELSPASPPGIAKATSASSKPSIAVLTGAAFGGLVLVLMAVGVAMYWRRRKKGSAPAPARGGEVVGGPEGPVTDKTVHFASAPSVIVEHVHPFTPSQRSLASSSGKENEVQHDIRDYDIGQPKHQQFVPGQLVNAVERKPLPIRPSIALNEENEGERTMQEDDGQIDRCLSYYMKRNSRSPATTSPQAPCDTTEELSPSPTRKSRRSFAFAKTANLLEKIRRSQIRLDSEALQSKLEGSPVPNKPGSHDATPSKYDHSSSFVTPERQALPAHWRSSSRDLYGSSPGHDAFEYADYYETHTATQEAFALPWMDQSPCRSSGLSPRQSPCRSSALSPRQSSLRQRSATFGQTDWSRDDSEDDGGGVRRVMSNLSSVKAKRRSEEEGGEVIRF